MIDLSSDSYIPSHIIIPSQSSLGAVHLGDINAALNLNNLLSNNIQTVITAANNMDNINYPPNTIKHIIYPLMDIKSQKISKYFNEVYNVIEEARRRGGVLVHCAAGVSRSATLVIAYIMRRQGWTFKQAIEFVREKRKIVCPNLGFEMQLKEYEKQCYSNKNKNKAIQNKQSILRIYDSLRKFNDKMANVEQLMPIKEKRILKHRRMSNMGKRLVEKNVLADQKLNLVNNFIVMPLKMHKEENSNKSQEEKIEGKREFRVKPKTSSYPMRYHNRIN